MNTFPSESGPYNGLGGGVTVFLDLACTQLAAINSATGAALPKSIAPVQGQRVQPFQSAASILYIRDSTGQTIPLYPSVNRTVPTVSGSKGANAALTSLIQALAAEGIIVDTTT